MGAADKLPNSVFQQPARWCPQSELLGWISLLIFRPTTRNGDTTKPQGHLVFQLDPDERQCPCRLCSQQATSGCDVGIAGLP
jgi:hypothetical protein